MVKLFSLFFIFSFLFLASFPVLAALPTPPTTGPIQTFEDVVNVIYNVRDWIYGVFLVLAVFFFVWAAFLFMTAGGDSTKVGEAKARLTYGVVALIVVALSVGLFTLIKNLLETAKV